MLSADGAGRPDSRDEAVDGPAAAFGGGDDDGPAEEPSSPKDDPAVVGSFVSCRRRSETAFCRRSDDRWAELWQSAQAHGFGFEADSRR